jgi:hypothetical protein
MLMSCSCTSRCSMKYPRTFGESLFVQWYPWLTSAYKWRTFVILILLYRHRWCGVIIPPPLLADMRYGMLPRYLGDSTFSQAFITKIGRQCETRYRLLVSLFLGNPSRLYWVCEYIPVRIKKRIFIIWKSSFLAIERENAGMGQRGQVKAVRAGRGE